MLGQCVRQERGIKRQVQLALLGKDGQPDGHMNDHSHSRARSARAYRPSSTTNLQMQYNNTINTKHAVQGVAISTTPQLKEKTVVLQN